LVFIKTHKHSFARYQQMMH